MTVLSQKQEGFTQEVGLSKSGRTDLKNVKDWRKIWKDWLKKRKNWLNKWEGPSQNRKGSTQQNEKGWVKTWKVQLKQKKREILGQNTEGLIHKSEKGRVKTRKFQFKNTDGLNRNKKVLLIPHSHRRNV